LSSRDKLLKSLSKILVTFIPIFLAPALYAYFQNENYFIFVPSLLICMILGIFYLKTPFPKLYKKDAYIIITLSWIATVFLGALPFLLSGINSVDSVFESMSALTTTGLEVLDVSLLSITSNTSPGIILSC